MLLILPLTMIGFGKYFIKKAPKEINRLFGYRTSMSMKNRDTWEFAHRYCGKIWYTCGMVTLPMTVVCMRRNYDRRTAYSFHRFYFSDRNSVKEKF